MSQNTIEAPDKGVSVASDHTNRTVDEGSFLAVARAYGEPKAKKLVDAIIDLPAGVDPEAAFMGAQQVIERLRWLRDEGASYTPHQTLGFGSENAATIASGILGERATKGKLRTSFAKLGKV